ncbi:hypothetical protein [Nonlabens ponticola]|uniref:Adhesin domain-containing protein n=1 Tax=Nonlabens ponticola TaxID=2496866 RepID=A0A3S9MW85_9FLAO|nr:hypothetical protein [Nonlabens ponticola]AZQ43471.1 hypothetical protein EJ995_04195 [Nonlabens ponticola]
MHIIKLIKQGLLYLSCLMSFSVLAQTDQTRTMSTIDSSNYDQVIMNFDQHVAIEISTNDAGKLVVNEIQAGEYHDMNTVTYNVQDGILYITDVALPHGTLPQDKLSAHKITDTRLLIDLPENKKLSFKAASANVKLSGNYDVIDIDLLNGIAIIDEIQGNATITTVNANIQIKEMPQYNYGLTGHKHLPNIVRDVDQVNYLLVASTKQGEIIVN